MRHRWCYARPSKFLILYVKACNILSTDNGRVGARNKMSWLPGGDSVYSIVLASHIDGQNIVIVNTYSLIRIKAYLILVNFRLISQ